MSKHVKKITLTPKEYMALATLYGNMFIENQTNYYFDTDDLYMNRKEILCSVSVKDNEYRVLIENCGKVYECYKFERGLCEQEDLGFKLFEAFGLRLQGRTVAIKRIIYRDVYCEVAISHNSYSGGEDYEIEIAYPAGDEFLFKECVNVLVHNLQTANCIVSIDDLVARTTKCRTISERFFRYKTNKG